MGYPLHSGDGSPGLIVGPGALARGADQGVRPTDRLLELLPESNGYPIEFICAPVCRRIFSGKR